MLVAARSGFGVVRALSYQVVEELKAGTLVRLLADFEPEAEPVHLVFAGGDMMRPNVRAFVEFGVAYLARLGVVQA
jgi:DNA-binding transcriptional LysR family regulator